MVSKKVFRKEAQRKRSALDPKNHTTLNDRLCKNLRDWIKTLNFEQIFYFLPFRNEPDLVDTICSTNITSGLPVVKAEDRSMKFYSWTKGESLIPNSYKIPEPDTNSSTLLLPTRNTLIIVPTLAMDIRGYRMGYGGGYYDRYLEKAPEVTTAGALFDQFVFDEIPTEAHDEKLSFAITDCEIKSF